jgi:hypothetical protein
MRFVVYFILAWLLTLNTSWADQVPHPANGPTSSTIGHFATFSNITGNQLADGGAFQISSNCGINGGPLTGANGTLGFGFTVAPHTTSTYSLTLADCGRELTTGYAGVANWTLLSAPSAGANYQVLVDNPSQYSLTLTATGGTINSAATLSVPPYSEIWLKSDGVSNYTGTPVGPAYVNIGATFTASGCANSTLAGGSTAGTYKSVTAGSCSVVITFGGTTAPITATNGWVCDAHDITTAADANNVYQTASSTTTATLTEGTVAANDVVVFKCQGY